MRPRSLLHELASTIQVRVSSGRAQVADRGYCVLMMCIDFAPTAPWSVARKAVGAGKEGGGLRLARGLPVVPIVGRHVVLQL